MLTNKIVCCLEISLLKVYTFYFCLSEEIFDPSTTSPQKNKTIDTGPKNGVTSLEKQSGTDSLLPPDDLELLKLEEPSWDDFFKDEKGKDPHDMMMGDAPALNSYMYNHGYNPADDYLENWDKRGWGRQRDQDRDNDRDHDRDRDRERNRVGGRRRKERPKGKQHNEGELADALPPNPTQGMPAYEMNEEISNSLVSETSRAPVKFQSCAELRCHAGGRCVADTLRGGVRCQCRLGNAGDFCEQGKLLL